MKFNRKFGTAALVLAMAAGTAGATLLAGEVSADAKPATHKVVVRPVTASGHAVKGYRVVKQDFSVECTAPSAAAVNKGIAFCGASADYTVACWRAAQPHRVLCLPTPTTKLLWKVRLDGKFPRVKAPRHPQPQELALANGDQYLVRDGGAAARLRQHPSWVAYYYGGRQTIGSIYGPLGSHGINTRHARWFVTTFRTAKSRGKRHDVTRAYYVGTAR